MECSGKATIVKHNAVMGRLERPVRWFRTSPPQRFAQYEAAVYVAFKEPRQRVMKFYDVVPDDCCYVEILDASGAVLWDSRQEVPCDMGKWEATRAEMGGRRAFTMTRYDSSGAVVNDGPGR
jgi:hypothetical protein